MTNALKIAVTGAGGFIGRHVVNELVRQDVSVIAITRDKNKLKEVSSKVQVVEYDLASTDDQVFYELGQPDILLHLAWDGLPNYLSLHHFDRELPLQYAFLQQMVMQGLQSLVVVGTCFEYGMQSGPLSENIETKPENPYGFAKDTLRKQLEFLKQQCTFNFTWARLFYLYGEGQLETSLQPQLKKAVEEGATQFNMSGGEQLRDYLTVKDAAYYLVAIALKQKDLGVVNVCSGEPCSVRTLVEKLLHDNKWKINLNLGYYPYPEYEPMAFWGVRRKLMRILGL